MPTVFKYKGFTFFFYSKEEERIHIHVEQGNSRAKFWLEPDVQLASSVEINGSLLKEFERIIRNRKNEIIDTWTKHRFKQG